MIANNALYKDIKINHWLLDKWDDEFIPSGIINNIVNCNFNYYKHWGYTDNICEDNYENDFHAAKMDIEIKGHHIQSGCVYSNIDDGRQNLTL